MNSRRAQAYKGLGKLKNAVDDLKAALRAAPADDAVMSALNEVEEMLQRQGDMPEISESQEPSQLGETQQRSEYDGAETLVDGNHSRPDAGGSSERHDDTSSGLGPFDSDSMKAAAEAIKSMNPDDLKSMMDISQQLMSKQDMVGFSPSPPLSPGFCWLYFLAYYADTCLDHVRIKEL